LFSLSHHRQNAILPIMALPLVLAMLASRQAEREKGQNRGEFFSHNADIRELLCTQGRVENFNCFFFFSIVRLFHILRFPVFPPFLNLF